MRDAALEALIFFVRSLLVILGAQQLLFQLAVDWTAASASKKR
jgi:hypothetical protein